ncbi:uncharacterized protein LOC103464475 [Poecilia reticulata]|uniref:uncharacterized protein LOC103464475 n=1 Tax=Poecilia reticulata TaxID=8081 RepID=UPI0004A25F2B|nr:PREDICTED: uncharacterized protein LOC103464475 [Poecilia reticulata]XP_008406821.1 PREDICTED: uncharacterized protein LOC103464475 [Poecilia reticulata]XP_008406822.1 PREDICTED: uncharacterized protein LOC103464475 [Poecilia reticulata]
MDGVLEGAVVLSACKLVCSFLVLPSLAASHSPVSFCCCSLLIFTDFLVTGFLSFLCILKFWLTELNPPGDVIALRFLLFLSHTYGAVLLLTTFLTATETLIRLLWPHAPADPRTIFCNGEEEEDGSVSDEGESLPQVVGFFCCLSVWIAVAFSVRWHWQLEEGWTAACLDKTDSLIRCLPNLFSPMHRVMDPYWSLAFLVLLGLLMTVSTGLQRRNQTSAEPKRTQPYEDGAAPAASKPLHPEMFTSKCVDGDFPLISHDCLSEEMGRQEFKRTQKHFPLDSARVQSLDSNQTRLSRRNRWGFPNLEENTVIALVSVLCMFTLPFYLSVNTFLIRTIDSVLNGCIKFLLSSVANSSDTSASLRVSQV